LTSENQSHLWRIVGVTLVVLLVAFVAVIGLRPTQRATFRSAPAPSTEAPAATDETISPQGSAGSESSSDEADALLDQAILLWLSDGGGDLEPVRQMLEDAGRVSTDSVEVKGALAILWAERYAREKNPEAREKAAAYVLEVEAMDSSSPLAGIARALLRGTQQPGGEQEARAGNGEALDKNQECSPEPLCEHGYRLLDAAGLGAEDGD